MSRNIDERDLENLLLRKQKHIGSGKGDIGSIISGVGLFASALGADFNEFLSVPGIVIKWLLAIIGLGVVVYGIVTCVRSAKRYDYMDLKKDILKLDKVESRHSLVAMRDYFNNQPMRYLVYYDENWECWLLPNFSTMEKGDNEKVKQGIAHMLGVKQIYISCKKIGEATHPKMSQRDKKNKIYQHSLYDVKVKKFSDIEKQDEFTLGDRKYKWMSISDMEHDPRIMECNSDVVGFVKEMIR